MTTALLETHIESINARFDRIEWQLESLINATEDLTARVAVLEQNTLTKADLDNTFAVFLKQFTQLLSK